MWWTRRSQPWGRPWWTRGSSTWAYYTPQRTTRCILPGHGAVSRQGFPLGVPPVVTRCAVGPKLPKGILSGHLKRREGEGFQPSGTSGSLTLIKTTHPFPYDWEDDVPKAKLRPPGELCGLCPRGFPSVLSWGATPSEQGRVLSLTSSPAPATQVTVKV